MKGEQDQLQYSRPEWVELETAHCRFRNDGIFEVRSKDGGMLKMTREARDVFSESDLALNNTNRVAIVIQSYVSCIIGNLFIGLNKTRVKIPIQLFTDEKAAVAWLKKE
jgi:hypothetical protein